MVQVLSQLADGSLAVSAMAGGNTVSSNDKAMTAPGSAPVDAMPNQAEQADPSLEITAKARSTAIDPPSFTAPPVGWKMLPGNGFSREAT